MEHFSIIVTCFIGMIGGLWGFFKYFSSLINRQFDRQDKRSDKTDDLILELTRQIARMQGGSLSFLTVDQCRLNSEKNDEKINTRFREVREEIYVVEDRLSSRIEKLEN